MRRTAAGAGGDKNQPSSRQTPQIPVPKGLDVSSEDLYILIETEELRYLLEVCGKLNIRRSLGEAISKGL